MRFTHQGNASSVKTNAPRQSKIAQSRTRAQKRTLSFWIRMSVPLLLGDVLVHDFEQLQDVMVREGIINAGSFFARRKQVGIFQDADLVRDERLRRFYFFDDVRNAFLGFGDGI